MKSTNNHSDKGLIFYRRDPLLWFLTNKARLSTLQIILLVVMLIIISNFGVGAILSYRVYSNVNMIRVLDLDHLIGALPTFLVFYPLVWLTYTWQPRGIVNTIESLKRNDVIVKHQQHEFDALVERMRKNVDCHILSTVSMLAVLIMFSIQTFIVYPAEALSIGRPYYWFHNKLYYYLLYTPLRFLSFYAATIVVLKGVLTLAWFAGLFRRLVVRVHPLHPDRAGGLGSLGDLAAKYSLVGVGAGTMATFYTIVRILIGGGWGHLDYLILYGLYIVITPVALFTPLWSAHRAMVRYRDQLLLDISTEFDRTLYERREGYEALSRWREKLQEVQAKHKFIRDTYPTWPISFAAARRFSVVALLPFLTSVVSIIVEIVTQRILTP